MADRLLSHSLSDGRRPRPDRACGCERLRKIYPAAHSDGTGTARPSAGGRRRNCQVPPRPVSATWNRWAVWIGKARSGRRMRSVFRPLLDTQTPAPAGRADAVRGYVCSREYHRLQTWFEDNDGYQIDVKIRTVLNGMGFGQETYDRVISGFSGGEKTRLAIARCCWKRRTC